MEYFKPDASYNTKFIFSLISAILYQLGSQVVVTIGNFCVYFASYIHLYQDWVNIQSCNIMAPTILLLLAIFSPISGIIEKYIGPKLTLLLSSIIVQLCLILYYFQKNLYIFYAISVFIGIGNGISAGVPIKNACLYFPKRKGIINSTIIFIGGLTSMLYLIIGEKIINPDKKPIEKKNNNPVYPEDVANRANYYFIFTIIVFPILTIIALLLFYEYVPRENQNGNNENIILQKKEPMRTDTKEIIGSFRFWRNMIIITLMPFWVYFLTATYRAYSTLIGIDQTLISYLPSIITFLSATIGLIWGYIFDKFGFKKIIMIMSIICIILSIYFTICIGKKVFYTIGLITSTFISRVGMMSVINPHIMQVYEFRNYLIIGGFARSFNQLSFFIAASISVILSVNNKTADSLETPYRIIASIGIALSIIGFIFSFYEDDSKFNIKDDDSKRKNTLGIGHDNENEVEIGEDKKT
jgi:MFS family permease